VVPLVLPDDLEDFPGAPFADSVVRAAGESVRADAGWHIAPIITETVTVDGPGPNGLLLLPSLRVLSVAAVTDLTGDNPVQLDGWRLAGSGMLLRRQGWPSGAAALEVVLTHGLDETPAELFPVVAARCQRSSVNSVIAQESLGARSVSYNVGRLEPETNDSALDRYRIPARYR
jgi:hypothetical protein